ncbi:PcfK-like family protein [Pedobacter cryoconitis]|nr:PcfK-like family protein [Pedobacter cryoconitis]
MKATDNFTKVINAHLHSLAEKDSLFFETLKKPNKNINDCIKYILNTVQKSGCNGFSDEEVFGMAVHYYDEDDIIPGSAINTKVVIKHNSEAIKQSFASDNIIRPVKKVIKKQDPINQPTLFG